jgi:hypothetical protein
MIAGVGYRIGDGCCPGEDPNGRGHLPTGSDGRGEQTSHSSQLSRPGSVVLPSPAGPESRRPEPCAVLSVWRGEWQWTANNWLAGQLALYCAGETQQSAVARRCLAHSAQPFPPADLRRGSRRGYGRLAAPTGSAVGTVRQLPEQLAGDANPQRSDRAGIMAFGSDAANLAGGSPTAAPGLIIQDFRYVLRGKNGSAR